MVLDVLVGGIVGGLVATIVMTVLMMVMPGDDPLPTQVFASKFINDKTPEQNQGLGVGLHLLYGALAGLLLMALAALGGFHTDLLPTFGFGLLWGLILYVGALFWFGIVGILADMRDDPPDERRKALVGILGVHIVYGAVAGVVGALLAGAV